MRITGAGQGKTVVGEGRPEPQEKKGMPRTTNQQRPAQGETSLGAEALVEELISVVHRLVSLCPPEDKKAILASLLEGLVAEYKGQGEIAVANTEGKLLGYFVPAGV